ncbi:hypothetical protein ACT6QH_08630 [Xanthobacter sp. TB0139]|uniref:hypothetical protein n=1 Tax=Xanthobacter sp. TB0139 TaxID=3459178 RepID=UPI0040394F46
MMGRILTRLALCAALLGASPWLLPVAKQSVRLLEARDNPAVLSDLALAHVDSGTVTQEMEKALAADDITLAASCLALADGQGLAVAPALRARVEAENGDLAVALRAAKDFSLGFALGEPDEMAGFAGALAGDLMVWGDIRDASREGWRLAMGEDADELILGLSVAGLAITGGTYATVGSGLPARAGVSVVKVAKRTGKLSAGLGRGFVRAARESVDLPALSQLVRSGVLDKAALKQVVRPQKLARLGAMLDDVATVQARAGTRAAMEGLKVADSGADLSRVAKLAEARGPQTLAILKTVGRGALVISGALLKLVWFGLGVLLYLFVLVAALRSLCVACVRPLWDGRRGRKSRVTKMNGKEDMRPANRRNEPDTVGSGAPSF